MVALPDLASAFRSGVQAPRVDAIPPAWLLPHQIDAWRRGRAALERFGTVVLAEDVGSGKTWIALGLAMHHQRPVVVLAPAILEHQWLDAAGRAGIAVVFHSHERLSRGVLPPGAPPAIIIDEAHRLRNPATRRVGAIAPWILGRATIFCTATPIVNRAADLCNLLDLVLADDALATDGIPSLGALAAYHAPPGALDRVVVRTTAVEGAVPRDRTMLAACPEEERRAAAGLAAIDQLQLSGHRSVARLVRTTMLDALASSDAAFVGCLRRYRALLAHARDAGGASRAVLRQFAGEALEQTALWSMLDASVTDGDLCLQDAGVVEAIIRAFVPSDHGWLGALRTAVADDLPTVCFARHRDTAHAIRHALGNDVAWVSGRAAGIGPLRLARHQVLAAFGPARDEWRLLRTAPRVLVATDVAAEGLDLQGAGRIVHADLPWTAVRMEQREGRLARIGQRHAHVAVVIRLPSRSVERELAPRARIERKASCGERWLAQLARHARDAGGPVVSDAPGPAVAVVRTRGREMALMLVEVTDAAHRIFRVVLCRDGSWHEGADEVETLFARAAASPPGGIPASELDLLFHASCNHVLRSTDLPRGHGAVLVPRVHRLASIALRRRDHDALSRLDRLLAFLSRPQPRGGRMLVEQLQRAADAALLHAVIPGHPRRATPSARVRGALVFRSTDRLLR